jgi:sec-independent protein translocase protein TatA
MLTPGTMTLTAIVAVLLVGTKRIRSLGEDLGAALRGFRKGLNGENESTTNEITAETSEKTVTTKNLEETPKL